MWAYPSDSCETQYAYNQHRPGSIMSMPHSQRVISRLIVSCNQVQPARIFTLKA